MHPDAMDEEALDIVHPVGPEPKWVTVALWFFPVPVFAFAVSATFLAIAIFFYIFASVDGSPILWGIVGLFGSLAAFVGAANLARSLRHRRSRLALNRYESSEKRPTFTIFVLLVSVYSWMLTLGFRVFRNFFDVRNLATEKYYVTVGIAIASSLYLALHGRSLLRRQLGVRGGRNIVVTPSQALMVILFAVSFGCYFAWLMK